VFDPSCVQLLSSGVAWARADLDRLVHDPPAGRAERSALVTRLARFAGSDERFDRSVEWYLGAGADRYPSDAEGDRYQPRLDDDLWRIRQGRGAADPALDVSGLTVLVSGASPRSIGEQVVASLLGSGATVVALTSRIDPARRRAWRALERRHAGPGARLFVVPANLASFRDVARHLRRCRTPAHLTWSCRSPLRACSATRPTPAHARRWSCASCCSASSGWSPAARSREASGPTTAEGF